MNWARLAAIAVASALVLPAAHAQSAPDGYPSGYQDLIAAARGEQAVTVYSNLPAANWEPLLPVFKSMYPWLTVRTVYMGGEIWERYYAESAAKAPTADIVITSDIIGWLHFIDRGEASAYESPEAAALPPWSHPFAGLYTMSTDPLILVYNKLTLPGKPPRSTGDVAEMAKRDGASLKGKITTYDAAANPFGLTAYWSWVKAKGGDWSLLDQIGPLLRPERTAGTMFEKLTTGEYSVGLFLSGALVPQLMDKRVQDLVGWGYHEDGTVIVLRGLAVTRAAPSPNAARLFLDFLLSRPGQLASAKGGLTPYRSDIAKKDVTYDTLQSISAAIGGEKNLIRTEYDRDFLTQRDQFIKRWLSILSRP